MPPAKVWIFLGSLIFILLVGLLFWEPENSKEIPCETGLHTHEGVPLHCD